MENIIPNPSLIVSIIGLLISLGALFVSYLSYANSHRPFIKLSDATAVSNKNNRRNYVEISVEITNFGQHTAHILSARVNTINMNKQTIGLDFDEVNILLYPGESTTISAKSDKIVTIAGTNIVVDYSKLNPGDFAFNIVYRSKDFPIQKFVETVYFSQLEWD